MWDASRFQKSQGRVGSVLESMTYSISKPDPRWSQMRHYSIWDSLTEKAAPLQDWIPHHHAQPTWGPADHLKEGWDTHRCLCPHHHTHTQIQLLGQATWFCMRLWENSLGWLWSTEQIRKRNEAFKSWERRTRILGEQAWVLSLCTGFYPRCHRFLSFLLSD